jgi:glyoxylate/hydroxypyruvate reductase A
MTGLSSGADRAQDGSPLASASPTIVLGLRSAEAAQEWAQALSEALPRARIVPDSADAPAADYAVLWRPQPGFFTRQPGLAAVFAAGAGVDWLLTDPTLPEQLPVYRIEDGGMAEQMAAYCAHEVLRFHYRYDRYEAQQREGVWQEWPYVSPARCAVGVFGMGKMGEAIARALAALGFAVRGYSRSPRALAGIECFNDSHGLEPFLAGVQVLVVAAPLTPATRNLFDATRLAQLPRGAFLINVARGDLVVDEALLAALDSGAITCAALDVFRTEPLPREHRFWTHPQVRITPHVAAITVVSESARQVARRITQLCLGEAPSGLVDRRRAY